MLVSILLHELGQNFYVTANREKETLFYIPKTWYGIVSNHVDLMEKGKMLIRIEPKPGNYLVAQTSAMPSGNKLRLLFRFRELLRSHWLHSEINIKGIKLTTEKIIVRLIEFLTDSFNDENIKNINNPSKIRPELQNYLENSRIEELQFLKCDIQRCYDSLSFSKVMKKVEKEIWDFSKNGQATKIYFKFDTVARRFGKYETLVSRNWRFSAKERKACNSSRVKLTCFTHKFISL